MSAAAVVSDPHSAELETGVAMLDTAPLIRDRGFHGRDGGAERRLDTSLARGLCDVVRTGEGDCTTSPLSENAERELSETDCVTLEESDAAEDDVTEDESLNGIAPRFGIRRPFALLTGVGGVRGELHNCFIVRGGVRGSSCSVTAKVSPSSPNGVESRLGGGELNPDFASGESPGRRLGER